MANYNSLRINDVKKEKILIEFLDLNFYIQDDFTQVVRFQDQLNQINGIDITFDIDRLKLKNIKVDEKAQLHYLDGGLPTAAFELLFRNKSLKYVEGWFTDLAKLTQFYMIFFVKTKDGKMLNTIRDIVHVEYLLISRRVILNYLFTEGFNLNRLRQIANQISKKGYGQHFKSSKAFYFFNSLNLAEKPVNLIIRKDKLITLSSMFGKIYPII